MKKMSETPSTALVGGGDVMGSRPDAWWRNHAQAPQWLASEIAPVVQSHRTASAIHLSSADDVRARASPPDAPGAGPDLDAGAHAPRHRGPE